ncbi:MAG: GspH/FimT family pseudopilin [Burkholderiales bacterium]|nr:GspH/FimT family pseudopilin [Burkholderiales bacterium]
MKIREFRRNNAQNTGFTLVELMVTVAILVILLAIGVPAMQGFMAQRQGAAKTDAFASAMRYARSEALKRAQPVTICLTTTADSTTPSCQTTGPIDWNTGWFIFVDNAPADGSYDVNKELLLKVQQPFTGGGSIAQSAAGHRTVQFTGDGLAAGSDNTFTAVTTSGDCAAVVLAPTGRVRFDKTPRGTTPCL